MTTPAGWYPDPSGTGGQRYWDGHTWSATPAMQSAPTLSRKQKGWLIAAVAVAAVFLAIVVISNQMYPAPDGHTPGTGSGSRSAAIGQPVADGKFTFTVTEAAPPGEHWYGQRPQGQWFFVTMQVANTGNEPQSFFVQNQKLIDSAGRQYAPDSMAAMSMNPTSTSMVIDMNPGFSFVVKIPFDVPPGTQVAAVEVHDSAYSGGARVSVGQGGG